LREKLGAYARYLASSNRAPSGLLRDFKMINGKIYKEATISRVEADGIVLRTKTGFIRSISLLPKDIQDRFHYSPVTPIAAQLKSTPTKVEVKQDDSRQD
jgi:hypothetical protein